MDGNRTATSQRFKWGNVCEMNNANRRANNEFRILEPRLQASFYIYALLLILPLFVSINWKIMARLLQSRFNFKAIARKLFVVDEHFRRVCYSFSLSACSIHFCGVFLLSLSLFYNFHGIITEVMIYSSNYFLDSPLITGIPSPLKCVN